MSDWDNTVNRWMIYGANGFSGRLVLDHALKLGLKPILAGRNSHEIASLSRELNLPARIFDVSEDHIKRCLQGVKILLNCAGPFRRTTIPLLQGCIHERVDYLDITGEQRVFSDVFSLTDACTQAGIRAIPGVGFDVVPSDCLALHLVQKLPDADHLQLGIYGEGPPSRGTLKTTIEGWLSGGLIRRQGELVPSPIGASRSMISFLPSDDRKLCLSVPWGDLVTAWHSTKIPNIITYAAIKEADQSLLRQLERLRYVLGKPLASWAARRWVARAQAGPTLNQREKSSSVIFAQVSNPAGKIVAMRFRMPNAYTFTANAAVTAVKNLITNPSSPPPGVYTPGQAFGCQFAPSLVGHDFEECPPMTIGKF